MKAGLGVILIVIVAADFCVNVAYAQKSGCSNEETAKALNEVDQLRTWDALYKSYKAHRLCDDGAVGEGYSDSVVRILVDQWGALSRLGKLARDDSGFRSFVLRHIDATVDPNDLKRIQKSATTRCPAGASSLCADISQHAQHALAGTRGAIR